MDKVEEAPRLEEIGNLFPPFIPEANSVSMKLPAFWPDAAGVWFDSVRYRECNCFQDKGYHVGAVLPQEVASQILDLIPTPPAVHLYKINNPVLSEPLSAV